MIKLRRTHLAPIADAADDTVTARDGEIWITELDDSGALSFVPPEELRNAAIDSWGA